MALWISVPHPIMIMLWLGFGLRIVLKMKCLTLEGAKTGLTSYNWIV